MIQRIAYPKAVVLACEHCLTIHEDVPVQCYKDGPYAELETEPCHADGCTAQICPSCPQFTCDLCGLKHCAKHKIEYAGREICPVCMQLEVEEGAEALMEETV